MTPEKNNELVDIIQEIAVSLQLYVGQAIVTGWLNRLNALKDGDNQTKTSESTQV